MTFIAYHIDFREMRSIVGHITLSLLVPGILGYWCSIACRAARWRMLLRRTCILPYPMVASALVVGFAANNVLPAKMGELVRADFLKRRTGIGRSIVLGSIVLERLQDSLFVLAALLFGFAGAPVPLPGDLKSVAVWAATPIVLLIIGTIGASGLPQPAFLEAWPAIAVRYRDFRYSLVGIWTGHFGRAALVAVGAWSIDLLSLWLVLRSLGVDFGIFGLALLTGSYSLASLLPSAPGYLGSYQLAFALVLTMYGFSVEQGVAAAFAVQLFLLVPLTLIGGILYVGRRGVSRR